MGGDGDDRWRGNAGTRGGRAAISVWCVRRTRRCSARRVESDDSNAASASPYSTVLHVAYSRSPKNPSLQLSQKCSKSASAGS